MPWLGISAYEETKIFLLACLFGGGLGVVYDLFRILRIALPHGKFAVMLEDFGYCFFLTFCNFLFLLHFCRGFFRVYVLAAEAIGFTVYYFTVGALFIRAAKGIVFAVKWALHFLYRITVAPVWYLLCLIGQKTLVRFRRMLQKCRFYKRICRFLLQQKEKVLYNVRVWIRHSRKRDFNANE